MERFATTILAQHSLITMLRRCFEQLQQCSNIVTQCCAQNRRCESSRVTSASLSPGISSFGERAICGANLDQHVSFIRSVSPEKLTSPVF